mmetsp:Transcript_1055/g.1951  ORF Transcript_1055/g.1951 Transcript_1055/m.1951 type:complete len:98 (-) Transcript_1055:926-1219(-)
MSPQPNQAHQSTREGEEAAQNMQDGENDQFMQLPLKYGMGRKTVGVMQQGSNDFIQQTAPVRNSMRTYNQIPMKSYDLLLPFFKNEPGLEYVDRFVY